MTTNPEKLLNVLRAIGLTNAMIDEDAAHWLIMTTPEQVDAPIMLRKQFVRLAQPHSIEFLLHEKLNNPQWQTSSARVVMPDCMNCFGTGEDEDLGDCPFCERGANLAGAREQ